MSSNVTCPDDLDIDSFVESVDPDWTDHFMTIDAAFRHYWKYLDDDEKKRALDEVYEPEQQSQFQAWQAAIDADTDYINEVSK